MKMQLISDQIVFELNTEVKGSVTMKVEDRVYNLKTEEINAMLKAVQHFMSRAFD